ncbi:hypothetical protein GDO81_021527 [Engystomops pustulosus]|uniref:ribonuclease H n=1 Tax=Engystomops pustulosus TaxID=76066 RepID=A0AAV6YTE2_ENGPU|nr:hypothetical protein GDO81_021527 [Engystomops pustulosus]
MDFLSLPPSRLAITYPASRENREAMFTEVRTLIQKKVLCQVPLAEQGQGFYSNLFLVKKPGGSLRVILNLKPLNRFLMVPKFKMETLKSAVNLLFPGCFMASIDLADAYYHIPIHQDFQKYLRVAIQVDSEVHHYQYRALPFGIAIAPRIFTKIVSEMAAHIRETQGLFIPYLDDFLLVGSSSQEVQTQLSRVLQILKKLGWLINKEKSSMVPTTRKLFLGTWLDSQRQRTFLPVEKVEKIRLLVLEVKQNPLISLRKGMSLLGLFSAAIPAVPWAQFHSRSLQNFLLQKWDRDQASLEVKILLPQRILNSLDWWLNVTNLEVGLPWNPSQDRLITTDASPWGWGAHMENQYFQGIWEVTERDLSSNKKELLAVLKALTQALPLLQGHGVAVMSDNTTTIAYINRQGGTRSSGLMLIATQILTLAETFFYISKRNSHKRCRKCFGRFFKSRDPISRGMGAESVSIPKDSQALGDASDRSFRHKEKSQGRKIFFPQQSRPSLSCGRLFSKVGQSSSLCLPPHDPPAQDYQKDKTGQGKSNFDSSLLASSGMVLKSKGAVSSRSLGASGIQEIIVAGPDPPSRDKSSASDGMAIERMILQKQGLSREVISTLQKSRKPVTYRIYHRIWKAYFSFSRSLI